MKISNYAIANIERMMLPMYSNLTKLMQMKDITIKQISELLGCKYTTVSGKINGSVQSGFTYDEALKIKKIFFPEYEIEYIFEREKVKSDKTA